MGKLILAVFIGFILMTCGNLPKLPMQPADTDIIRISITPGNVLLKTNDSFDFKSVGIMQNSGILDVTALSVFVIDPEYGSFTGNILTLKDKTGVFPVLGVFNGLTNSTTVYCTNQIFTNLISITNIFITTNVIQININNYITNLIMSTNVVYFSNTNVIYITNFATNIFNATNSIFQTNFTITNTAPIASIFVLPGTNGNLSTWFIFNASDSWDLEDSGPATGTNLRFRWDYNGDGLWETLYNTNWVSSNKYSLAGTYTLRLDVIDRSNAVGGKSIIITITNTNSFPSAFFGMSPTNISFTNTRFTFDASASVDIEDGTNLFYRWDFDGDGVYDSGWSLTNKVVSFQYTNFGVYTNHLQVKDSSNAISEYITNVDVRIIWKYSAGGSFERSSPVITNGKIYIGCSDSKLYCLNASNGSLLWAYPTWGAIKSSPAFYSNFILFGSFDGKMYCLNATTRALQWSYSIAVGQIYSSPCIFESRVYFSGLDSMFYCLNFIDGNLIWNYNTGSSISSPIATNGCVYTGECAGSIYCFNATNGNLIWQSTTNGSSTYSGAYFFNSKIFVGRGTSSLFTCLDSANGNIIWNFKTAAYNHSSPTISGSSIYFASQSSSSPYLYSIDVNSGSFNWAYKLDNMANYNSPLSVNNKIYIADYSGTIYSFNNLDGSLLWKYSIPFGMDNDLAIYDGKLYFGSSSGDNAIYCLFAESTNVSKGNSQSGQSDY